ncbi:MAG: STAS domain-containing protein [Planctomycetota bacterium]
MLVDRDQNLLTIRIVLGPVFTPGYLSSTIPKQVQDGDRHVLLDLRHVEIVHSPMLGELVQVYIHLQKRDISLEVTHVSENNRRLFRYTRLDELLSVQESI